jgi:hypothetical protein
MESFDSTPIDLMLSTLIRLAEAGFSTNITLFVKGNIISGDLISTKEYVRILEEELRNSHQINRESDNVYKIFDLLFDQVGNVFSENIQEASDKPIMVLHINNARYKSGDTWSNKLNNVIRVNLNSVDGFFWGKEN